MDNDIESGGICTVHHIDVAKNGAADESPVENCSLKVLSGAADRQLIHDHKFVLRSVTLARATIAYTIHSY